MWLSTRVTPFGFWESRDWQMRHTYIQKGSTTYILRRNVSSQFGWSSYTIILCLYYIKNLQGGLNFIPDQCLNLSVRPYEHANIHTIVATNNMGISKNLNNFPAVLSNFCSPTMNILFLTHVNRYVSRMYKRIPPPAIFFTQECVWKLCASCRLCGRLVLNTVISLIRYSFDIMDRRSKSEVHERDWLIM